MMTAARILAVLLFCVPAVYYFVFALASKLGKRTHRTGPCPQSRYAILIPAYRSDAFIAPTVRAALDQDYPADRFSVLVISDGMSEDTDAALRQMGADVLTVKFANSTKAASLEAAMEHLGPDCADYAVILDSDNIISPTFLRDMNAVAAGRRIAVQAHRCAKNTDTPVAVADAVSEEVNNAVFRKGHDVLGLSSALIGSGMSLPYGWFFGRSKDFVTAGEDKEMELALLHDGVRVAYAEDIPVLDEKTRTAGNFKKQRLRWLASQYTIIGRAAGNIFSAKLALGYADKLFQWLFIPRILIFFGLPCLVIAALLDSSAWLPVYAASLLALLAALLLGIPKTVKARDIASAALALPGLMLGTISNILHIRRSRDGFIHTDHI